jgi:hypothetical protein
MRAGNALNRQKRASSPESRQSMALQISLYCLSQLAITKASAVAVTLCY